MDTVGSTNDWLKERARIGAPPWSAAVADSQTAGRGRHGRSWLSPPGNLFLSVLLPGGLPATAATLLPLAAGVAAAEAAEELGVPARLKWPNDLMVAGRKVGGILVEGLMGRDGLDVAVVGFGINLSLPASVAEAQLAGRATSISAESGRAPTTAAAAAAVLARLAVWYDALRRGETDALRAAWVARSLPWWGRLVEARSGETVLRGRASGLDERGALLLELEDGSRTAVVAGEVRELRLSDGPSP